MQLYTFVARKKVQGSIGVIRVTGSSPYVRFYFCCSLGKKVLWS